MKLNDIRQSGLLEYYVLGLLSEQDAQMVERYLVDYPELQTDYLEIQKAMQVYAKSQGIAPKRNLVESIKSEISANGSKDPVNSKITSDVNIKNTNNPSTQKGGSDWKSFALPALLAAVLFFSWQGYNKGLELDNLQQEYNTYKEDCVSQQEEANRKRNIYAHINTPNNRTIELTPTDGYKESNLLFHNNNVDKRNYIQVKNLPQIAANQAFQLWSLKDGIDPIPLTVFKNGEDLIIPVDFEEGTGTYAITIEDEAGATVPTLSRLIGTIGV